MSATEWESVSSCRSKRSSNDSNSSGNDNAKNASRQVVAATKHASWSPLALLSKSEDAGTARSGHAAFEDEEGNLVLVGGKKGCDRHKEIQFSNQYM